MKNKIISAILLASFTMGRIANAEELTKLPKIETPYGEIDPGEALSPMNKGQKAAFSGVLFSPKAVAKVTVDLKSVDDKVALEVGNAIRVQQEVCARDATQTQITVEADKKILMASIDEKMRTISLYEEQLKKESRKLDSGLLVGIGIAVGVSLTTLSALAISQLTK